MIEKNQNVNDVQIKRIVQPDATARQITLQDGRFYQRKPDLYYPSVTTVLSYFPKDKFFESWIKDVGHNADIIMRRAGEEGTQVHTAVEAYLKGEEVTWLNSAGFTKYSLQVWKMILKFVEFWETYKPKLIESEVHLFSDKLQVAGTADLIVEINGELWLLDLKTSNSLSQTFDLQLACYATAWNECYSRPIDRMGIVWLKAATRGPSRSEDKMQGKGWEVKEATSSLEENQRIFSHLYEIFKLKHPELKPSTEILPTSVKLKDTL